MITKDSTVEFVSYSGRYPNLCRGDLVLRIDGEEIKIERYSGQFRVEMHSGGNVTFDSDWQEEVTDGPWSIEVSDDLKCIEEKILDCIQGKIPNGCCGGCV